VGTSFKNQRIRKNSSFGVWEMEFPLKEKGREDLRKYGYQSLSVLQWEDFQKRKGDEMYLTVWKILPRIFFSPTPVFGGVGGVSSNLKKI
jgi:hypothetical protein